MWYLTRKKDGKTIYLLCNKEYTVGRKNCTVLVCEDVSVSRKHLILKVHSRQNETEVPLLLVMDLGSTYGTYINPISTTNTGKIQPNNWVTLSKGSVLHFGVGNEWLVHWMNIKVLCSAMSPPYREKLSIQLQNLGGTQEKEWNNCVTHLIMEKIVFTHKVMQCLIAAKPILKVEYFEAWHKSLEDDPTSPVPTFDSFIPQIDAQLAHLNELIFLPRTERCRIFKDTKFIFASTEQFTSMSKAVVSAGGLAVTSYDDSRAALVEYSGADLPSRDYLLFYKTLKEQGRRIIPLKEIGLAILHCSTERYCNQWFKLQPISSAELPLSSSEIIDRSDGTRYTNERLQSILVPETVSVEEPLSKKLRTEVVPNTTIKNLDFTTDREKRNIKEPIQEVKAVSYIENENHLVEPEPERKETASKRAASPAGMEPPKKIPRSQPGPFTSVTVLALANDQPEVFHPSQLAEKAPSLLRTTKANVSSVNVSVAQRNPLWKRCDDHRSESVPSSAIKKKLFRVDASFHQNDRSWRTTCDTSSQESRRPPSRLTTMKIFRFRDGQWNNEE